MDECPAARILPQRSRRHEIRAHPVPEIARLPDVDDLPRLVPEYVDSRSLGNILRAENWGVAREIHGFMQTTSSGSTERRRLSPFSRDALGFSW